jgi:hypothetical protein
VKNADDKHALRFDSVHEAVAANEQFAERAELGIA